jgi:hypothetical protein
MFIVAEAGVFCVCKQQQLYSIRSIRDASVGIPWIGSSAAGNAAFMLVREVPVVVDMMICQDRGEGGEVIFKENCQETSRRDTANKRSLELCASIVLIF